MRKIPNSTMPVNNIIITSVSICKITVECFPSRIPRHLNTKSLSCAFLKEIPVIFNITSDLGTNKKRNTIVSHIGYSMRVMDAVRGKDSTHVNRELYLKFPIVMITYPTILSMIRYHVSTCIIKEFQTTPQYLPVDTVETVRLSDTTAQITLTKLC